MDIGGWDYVETKDTFLLLKFIYSLWKKGSFKKFIIYRSVVFVTLGLSWLEACHSLKLNSTLKSSWSDMCSSIWCIVVFSILSLEELSVDFVICTISSPWISSKKFVELLDEHVKFCMLNLFYLFCQKDGFSFQEYKCNIYLSIFPNWSLPPMDGLHKIKCSLSMTKRRLSILLLSSFWLGRVLVHVGNH